jgi:CHAT domain-containing protein
MAFPFSMKRFILCTLFSWLGLSCYSQKDEDLNQLIYDYGLKGWYNLEFNVNLDTAEYYLSKALELQYSHYSELDDRVVINHVSLAAVYRRLYNYDNALVHLTKAENLLLKFDPDNVLFGMIYNNKGNLISATNDVYRTKDYYEYALEFLERIGSKQSEFFLHIYTNYINLLIELGEYEQVKELLEVIGIDLEKATPFVKFRFNIINGNGFSRLGNFESALNHFDRARAMLNTKPISNDNYSKILYYYHVIDFYTDYGDYLNAHKLCAEAFTYIESLSQYAVKDKVTFFSKIQYRKAWIFYLEGKNSNALNLVDIGIDNLISFFNDLSLDQSNVSIRTIYSSMLPQFKILKSRVLFNLYSESKNSSILISAFDTYQESLSIINSLKISMLDEESRFFATSQILDVYNEAVYVGKLLYDMTHEMEYLEKSFEFTESSKSFALFSEIRDVEAMEFSDLPSDVKEKEERLLGEIQAYEEMMYDEQLAEVPDTEKIAFYRDKLFHLEDDYNDLKQDIERNNEQYFELKYNPKFIKLQEVQKQLPYRDAMIEYVLNDTLLITYIIDRQGINVISQEIDRDFEDECLEFYRLIHTQNFSSGVHDNYRRFVSLGRKFYKVLIEPCLEYTERQNLTIVPDGAITYLPFEALLTEDADQEYINYLVLPYMIRKFSVGYSHSSTLMFSKRIKTRPTENRVLAFAPDYKDPLRLARDTSWYRQVLDSDFLLPIPGVLKEVQSINESVPSRVFLKEQATERNFKQHAPDYNVLHLAMHTLMRDDNPLWSMLAFTNVNDADTIEDNRLYAYEIYNMKLNAQMVVLSSCSSGFGKMQKGEGMMSLARGFIYAGCPSIVMTLWQVSDKSSSDLMTSFYRYLKKGKSKQEAMRMAKLGYLESADDLTSNPYFWSGFVVLGDSSPIYRKSGISYWALIISAFVGVILYVQYRKPVKI